MTAQAPSVRPMVFAALTSAILLVWFVAFFGSADVEESANSAFSAGIGTVALDVAQGRSGTHALFGVPIYDTQQGTGDRLPYQASWGQSITWPLRFVSGWDHYALLRTLFFVVPTIYLCFASIQSWIPRISTRTLFLTAFLTNSSVGIYMRWNDWSDHFVQTSGVCAICFFLMHKWFHDVSDEVTRPTIRWSLLCLFISLNGVLTGHPGFWPVAVVVPTTICLGFVSNGVFRQRFTRWLSAEWRLLVLGSMTLLMTFFSTAIDLAEELQGQVWGQKRLSRTQGLFSEYAFQGVYGLRPDGFLSEPIRRVFSVVMTTTVLPIFILFDTVLPRIARVTDYAELTRLEFSGPLVFLLLFRPLSGRLQPSLQAVMTRLAISQLAIWVFVVAATLDRLPTAAAPSGAWLVVPVVLALNGFISVLVFATSSKPMSPQKVVAGGNLALIGVWCLFQYGVLSMGTGLHFPERIPTWFGDRDDIAADIGVVTNDLNSTRVILSAPLERRPLMNLISLGVAVISPADPKIRTQSHLVDGFAFNYSIDPPSLGNMSRDYADQLLDFLQVTDLVVQRRADGQLMSSEFLRLLNLYTNTSRITLPNRWGNGKVEEEEVEVLHRDRFSAFVVKQSLASKTDHCPHLKKTCDLLMKSTRLNTNSQPKLVRCTEKCLWRFATPEVRADEVLLLPITFDTTLVAESATEKSLKTMDVGGFLAVYNATGFKATQISIYLNPDFRMVTRVIASYLSLLTFVFLVVASFISGCTPLRPRQPRTA